MRLDGFAHGTSYILKIGLGEELKVAADTSYQRAAVVLLLTIVAEYRERRSHAVQHLLTEGGKCATQRLTGDYDQPPIRLVKLLD